jgi:hypothetical protein
LFRRHMVLLFWKRRRNGWGNRKDLNTLNHEWRSKINPWSRLYLTFVHGHSVSRLARN